mgnify:CR=1 FL=1
MDKITWNNYCCSATATQTNSATKTIILTTKQPQPLDRVSIVLSPLFLIIKPNIRQNAKKPNNSINTNIH